MYITGISKYSSLNFDNEWYNDFEVERNYEQKFQVGDRIVCQFNGIIDDEVTNNFVLANYGTCTTRNITIDREINISDDSCVGILDLTSIITEPGTYLLSLLNGNYNPDDPESQEYALYSLFYVYEEYSPDLEETIKISYTHRKNDFDTIFIEDPEEIQFIFDFRVEAAFIRANEQYKNDTNSFHDQGWYNRQLSSFAYTSRVLTIGNTFGVPGWVGEKINFIFSLSDVEINGEPYVRSEGAQVEVSPIGVNYPMSVYQIAIEKKTNRYSIPVQPYQTKPEDFTISMVIIGRKEFGNINQGLFAFYVYANNVLQCREDSNLPLADSVVFGGRPFISQTCSISYIGYTLRCDNYTATGQQASVTIIFNERLRNIKLSWEGLAGGVYDVISVQSAGSQIRQVINNAGDILINQ